MKLNLWQTLQIKRRFLILILQHNKKLRSHIQNLTDNRLWSASLTQDKTAKIIKNLYPNKAHGHDNISIRILKVCDSSIYKPLVIVSNQCTETIFFRLNQKKGNIVPIHKIGDKQKLKNCHRVSLLPICQKILERSMFNKIF